MTCEGILPKGSPCRDCLCILGKVGDLGLLAQPSRSLIGPGPGRGSAENRRKIQKHPDPVNRSAERRRKNLVGGLTVSVTDAADWPAEEASFVAQIAAGDVRAPVAKLYRRYGNSSIASGYTNSVTEAWPRRWFRRRS